MKNSNNQFDTDTERAAFTAYVIATVDTLLKPEIPIVEELLFEQGLTEQEIFECLHEDICDRYMRMLNESDEIEDLFDKYFDRIRSIISAGVRHADIEFHVLCPDWDTRDPMAREIHNKRQLLGLAFDFQLRLIEA